MTDSPRPTAQPWDEVDRIVAAWRRVRPDLDTGPLQILSRVTRLAHHLATARSRAFADHGLANWEFDVLAALRRSGPPPVLAAGALAVETLVTSGTMTNRIDRLASRGLVIRRADPADGRSVLVILTPAGGRAVDAAIDELLSLEQELMAALPEELRQPLADGLRLLLAAVGPQGS